MIATEPLVAWHDAECGRYRADLPLWRELAAAARGPVLDVGAGTGRVALDLARRGIAVTALDREPALLAALAERAAGAGVEVETVVADAARFDAGEARFGLVAVPMQTIQLVGDRAGFLACARRSLRRGGLLAMAVATRLEPFDPGTGPLPAPDTITVGGVHYRSQPVAVRPAGDAMRLERLRETVGPDGSRTLEHDVLDLAVVTAYGLAVEGREAGFAPLPPRRVDPTVEHVGSEVVLLRA